LTRVERFICESERERERTLHSILSFISHLLVIFLVILLAIYKSLLYVCSYPVLLIGSLTD